MLYAIIILSALLLTSCAFHYLTWEKLTARASCYKEDYFMLSFTHAEIKEKLRMSQGTVRGLRFNALKDRERYLIVKEERDGAHMLLEKVLSQNADIEMPKLNVQSEIGRAGVHYVFSYEEPRDISTMELQATGKDTA